MHLLWYKKLPYLNTQLNINLLVNVDGLPVAKSSTSQLWPILVACKILKRNFIFPVALFFGPHKLEKLDFFNLFVAEINYLSTEFLFNGFKILVNLENMICDAPARSFVTFTKGHRGYFECPKYITEDNYLNGQMCFSEINATLRNDESF